MSFRLTIFKSALKRWERRFQIDQSGERPLHRERNWKREERQKEKERKKIMVHEKGRKPTQRISHLLPSHSEWYTSIIMETDSWGNQITEQWLSQPTDCRARWSSTHELGNYRTTPMETDNCGKQGCSVCESGKGSKNKQCLKTTKGGAGYAITSRKCRTDNIVSIVSLYHGEISQTSRTPYSRLVEHAKGRKNKKEERKPSIQTWRDHPWRRKTRICIWGSKIFPGSPHKTGPRRCKN